MTPLSGVFAAAATLIWLTASGGSLAQDGRDERITPALVHITAKDRDAKPGSASASATGFFVSPQGYLVTSEHVLSQFPDLGKVQFVVESPLEKHTLDKSSIVKNDLDSGVLVLKVDTPLADRKYLCFLPEAGEHALRQDDTQIFSSGFPDEYPFITTQGLIESLKGADQTWLTSLPIYPGQSGAPVYTASGQVLGMAKDKVSDAPKGAQGGDKYAIVPVTSFRDDIAGFGTDCRAPNTNTSIRGAPSVEPNTSSLPPPTACIFLGKTAATKTKKPDDAPFGLGLLEDMIAGRPADTAVAITDVNVRSSCPIIRDSGSYYGSVLRVVKSGENLHIKSYQPFSYAKDTYYWGILAD
jgi:hypothetical protein